MFWWNLRRLKSRKPQTRRQAADKLGVSRDRRAVERLLEALNDKEPGVRAAAAYALALIRDERAVKPLTGLLGDGDWHVRQAAAQGLGKICDPREDPQAIEVRSYRTHNGGIVGPLAAALKDEESGVREAAAGALGKIGIANERAVEALAEFGSPAVSALLVAMKHGKDFNVELKARGALSRMGGLDLPVLLTALRDQDRDVRSGAAMALHELGDPRAVEPLLAAIKDKDLGVRQAAANALGKLGDTRAVEPLVAALKDKADMMRSTAVRALGKIRDKRAIKPLLAVLNNPYLGGHDEAAWALGEIGAPQAVKTLAAALKNPSSRARESAAEALGKISDPRVIDLLAEALKDESRNLRLKAARVLGRIGDPRAKDLLVMALRDEDAYVREASRESLDQIGRELATVEERVNSAKALRPWKDFKGSPKVESEAVAQQPRAADHKESSGPEKPTFARDFVRDCLEPRFEEEKEPRRFNKPEEVRVLAALGNGGKYSEVIKKGKAFLEKYADFDYIYFWMGCAYLDWGNLEDARSILEEGLRKAKSKSYLCLVLGQVERKARNAKDTLKWWCQSVHCHESNPYDLDQSPYLYLASIAGAYGLSRENDAFTRRAHGIRAASLSHEAFSDVQGLFTEQKTKDIAKVITGMYEMYFEGHD